MNKHHNSEKTKLQKLFKQKLTNQFKKLLKTVNNSKITKKRFIKKIYYDI